MVVTAYQVEGMILPKICAPPSSAETGTRKPEKFSAGMMVAMAVRKMAATCERVKVEKSRPMAVEVQLISRVARVRAASEPFIGRPNQ